MENVCWCLSKDARSVFVNEYKRLYKEKHGCSRDYEEYTEQKVYKVTSVLTVLITAFQLKSFPSFAKSSKEAAINGDLLKDAVKLFE